MLSPYALHSVLLQVLEHFVILDYCPVLVHHLNLVFERHENVHLRKKKFKLIFIKKINLNYLYVSSIKLTIASDSGTCTWNWKIYRRIVVIIILS